MSRAFTQLQSPIFIHPQQSCRRSADRRQANDCAVAICEMLFPIVKPGMKQARQFSSFWIKTGKICAFGQIAMVTGEREIFHCILSAMLARRDVFDMERQRFLLLQQPAIFTTIFRALPDQLSQPRVHQFALDKIRRDLA